MNLLKRLLGGRPMQWMGFSFVDCVSGRCVHEFRDTLGRWWMAEHPWAWFRVPIQRRSDNGEAPRG